MEVKQCYKCLEVKPVSEFHRNAQRPDGLTVLCKPCAIAKTRAWCEANRDYKRAQRLSPSRQAQKTCNICGFTGPATREFFYRNPYTADGLEPHCRTCSKVAFERERPQRLEAQRALYAAKRRRVLSHYSGGGEPCCACCGETIYQFLAIDHIDGGGAKHLKEIGPAQIAHWLIKRNFPPGFQILCHNCNFAKGHYGCCPHQEEKEL